MLPVFKNRYTFKFPKKTMQETEDIMLKTCASFEFYIPYEKSEIEFVFGAVFTQEEVDNLSNYFNSIDEQLLGATPEEVDEMENLIGLECGYLKNIYRARM